ncbi:hypothetical protein [Methanoculleus sp. UBA303]|jgi:hypothetical protein|uniref:hypothetical protein n=1 Tax=Methanoculleus sp. UBA303 TaxID=1915497 RepID=UPI0025FCF7C1|nr:hypothetical protein [Methanoculleus sp. UBA303]
MTSVQMQVVGDILLGPKNGKNRLRRYRRNFCRTIHFFGTLKTVLSGVGSQITTNGEEALTYNLATCRYRIREHGPASLTECGIRLLILFRQNCYAGIIRRRLKQQACDRL